VKTEAMKSNDGLEPPSSNCIASSHDCIENASGATRTSIGIDDDGFSRSRATSVPEISLPILKYGYCTKPLQWDEIVDIIYEQRDLPKMSRSRQQQFDYELFKRNTLLQWKSMTDFVLCTKFSNIFTKKIVDNSEHGPRFVADPPIDRLPPGLTLNKLVKNDFPYYMADGIEHWVLWKLGSDCSITDQDIQKAKENLSDRLQTEGVGMIHWINPFHLKSVPLIEHAHILGKVKSTTAPSDRI
jgi:Protein of unknown function (DUF3605)